MEGVEPAPVLHPLVIVHQSPAEALHIAPDDIALHRLVPLVHLHAIREAISMPSEAIRGHQREGSSPLCTCSLCA